MNSEGGYWLMHTIDACFLLFVLLLIYYFGEDLINRKCLSSFKAVIHVNGIRGKTSTCRYLDAALRTKYKVFTKTTGTDAHYIDVNGQEHPVRRLGPANIHEQIRMIRRAKRENAEILILECMAVNPELQKVAQERIVKSSITVITNARYDHIFEMGDTLKEITASLAATVPANGFLYTADPMVKEQLSELCAQKNCQLILCPGTGTDSENLEIVKAISSSLGVSGKEFESSLQHVKADFGTKHLYRLITPDGNMAHFLNLFSANDPQSTKNLVKKYSVDFSHLMFLYNHREDRPDRALLFARYFFPAYSDCRVYLTGSGAALPKRLFRQAGVSDLHILSDWHLISRKILYWLESEILRAVDIRSSRHSTHRIFILSMNQTEVLRYE